MGSNPIYPLFNPTGKGNMKTRKQNVDSKLTTLEEGVRVFYTDDSGKEHETITRSKPWQLGHGDWVVLIEGKSGGYDLSRIRKPL